MEQFLNRYTSIIITGLFLLVAAVAVLPQFSVNVSGEFHDVSIGDLMQTYKEYFQSSAAEDLPFLGNAYAAARKLVLFFLVTSILMILLPVIEAVLALVLRRDGFLLPSALGILVNTSLKVIVVSRINSLGTTAKDVLELFGGGNPVGDTLVRANPGPLTMWILLHILVIAVIALYLIRCREGGINESFMEESSAQRQERTIGTGREFFGEIAEIRGGRQGRSYPMEPDTAVTIGGARDDVIRLNRGGAASLCQISYAEGTQEYRIRPRKTRSVFLRSGQPLGKARTYSLPRGTEIMIGDSVNRFILT